MSEGSKSQYLNHSPLFVLLSSESLTFDESKKKWNKSAKTVWFIERHVKKKQFVIKIGIGLIVFGKECGNFWSRLS